MRDGYDIAQICPNGHVANEAAGSFPLYNQDYCKKCGQKTITNCPNCGNPIRGGLLSGYTINYRAPAFCVYCGHAFPWTESAIQAAKELAQELELSEG